MLLLLVSTLGKIWGTWRWWCHNYKWFWISKSRFGTKTMDQKQNITMIMRVNSRLDELQAAFKCVTILEIENDKRSIARRYLSEIKNDKIILPYGIYRIIMFFICYSNKQQTGITRLFTEKRSTNCNSLSRHTNKSINNMSCLFYYRKCMMKCWVYRWILFYQGTSWFYYHSFKWICKL
jgi:hypothetical protein